ncbi:Holliday junction branch migration protein RuvA [Anaerotignum faecicola]|nr:Holliday junction branch migration protein RuvA [Anaerotignum faecicola]
MISYITGSLEYIGNGDIIVETGGIGYRVYISSSVMAKLPRLRERVKVYTYMSVKEDGISLFGFNKMEELELFNKLITVNGVGPKAAISLMGALSYGDIIMAVVSEDAAALSKAPGLGKKTAQKIILELKDKFKNEDFLQSIDSQVTVEEIEGVIGVGGKSEAIEALMALGYTKSEAARAVGAVYNENMDTQELLKAALKQIVKI